ncbi:hypothetical protein [Rhodococcus marinonascens]|uniref:hypothetical protein n=1 Tax=Rhodococcus marinonascens TaxID=38311 RepID=UPI000AAB55C8|nr:hypothetical protein [Rhodococcus marinonascens]
MPGRPPLRIGQHGKVTRVDLGADVWLARCRFRDDDGVARIVERRSPAGRRDQHGKLAEQELLDALDARRTPSEDEVTAETTLSALCRAYLLRIEEEGRSTATMDTYRFAAGKLEAKIGGVRVLRHRLDGSTRPCVR